jgi:hypothetical protein
VLRTSVRALGLAALVLAGALALALVAVLRAGSIAPPRAAGSRRRRGKPSGVRHLALRGGTLVLRMLGFVTRCGALLPVAPL